MLHMLMLTKSFNVTFVSLYAGAAIYGLSAAAGASERASLLHAFLAFIAFIAFLAGLHT